ncbi:MAG TPA: ECF-type sigma factor [Pyrinomonadaceae bacterium]
METHQITNLLQAWNGGDSQAFDQLLPLVDHELIRIARGRLKGERTGNTFQTGDLLNEALIKLLGHDVSWTSRKHFYALVARRMSQVLIDHARKKHAKINGGGMKRTDWDDKYGPSEKKSREIVAVNEALTSLSQIDERKALIVEYRYFVGLTIAEVSKLLQIAPSTVQLEWDFARLWLKQQLTNNGESIYSSVIFDVLTPMKRGGDS